MRALFYGDSLVAGVGDPAGAGWVGRVAAACASSGSPVTVYNLGVRRQTSVEVVSRWRAEALPRVPDWSAARIVVSFGANDTRLERGAPRVEPERSLEALSEMLDQAIRLGCDLLTIGPAPVDEGEQNVRIAALDAAFGTLCAERGAPFISVFDGLRGSALWTDEVAAKDGAHPSTGGYELLARTLLDAGIVAWLTAGDLRRVYR